MSCLLTYSTGELARALLQQPDYLRLLGGRAPTADHSGTLARQLHELIFIVLQANLQDKRTGGTDEPPQTRLISTVDRCHQSGTFTFAPPPLIVRLQPQTPLPLVVDQAENRTQKTSGWRTVTDTLAHLE